MTTIKYRPDINMIKKRSHNVSTATYKKKLPRRNVETSLNDSRLLFLAIPAFCTHTAETYDLIVKNNKYKQTTE